MNFQEEAAAATPPTTIKPIPGAQPSSTTPTQGGNARLLACAVCFTRFSSNAKAEEPPKQEPTEGGEASKEQSQQWSYMLV